MALPRKRWPSLLFAFAALVSVRSLWASEAGELVVAVGEIRIVGADGKARPAARGSTLLTGDRVVTGEGALVQIRLRDGGMLSVRPNTEIALDRFVHDEKTPSASSFVMSLVRGSLRSITGLIGRSNPDAYRIQTPTATIGIRGTDHEPAVFPEPPAGIVPKVPPGTYDKVNAGKTFLQTPKGVVELGPGQAGFVPKADVAPRILPKIPDFYRELKDARPALPGDKGQNVAEGKGQEGKGPEGKGEDVRGDQRKPELLPGSRLGSARAGDKGQLLEGGAVLRGEGLKPEIPAKEGAIPVAPAVRDAAIQIAPALRDSAIQVAPVVKDAAILQPIAPATSIAPTVPLSPATTTPIAPATSTILAPTTSTILSPTTTPILAPATTTSPTTTTIPTIKLAPTTTISPLLVK